MCSRTTCSSCGKADWAGCGAHVEQALRGVAPEDRCGCRQDAGPQTQRAGNSLWDRFRTTPRTRG